MGGYIAHFTVYTMAMAGLICFAVFVYKKVMDGSFRGNNSKYLAIEETMSLNPRKTLHIVRAGNERFLIASDVDRTTLISKLDATSSKVNSNPVQFQEYLSETQQEEISVQSPSKQRVHLEPIKTKAKHVSKGMDRHGSVNPNTNTVELDFNKPANHGYTTMREMAKKINEL